jgi:hypothetical protein
MSLLGDIFPPEWPPQGMRKGGAPHPAPTQMVYRGVLARSFEKSTDMFRRLIYFGIGIDSRIVRAVLVRMCARASGVSPLNTPMCYASCPRRLTSNGLWTL